VNETANLSGFVIVIGDEVSPRLATVGAGARDLVWRFRCFARLPLKLELVSRKCSKVVSKSHGLIVPL